MSEPRRLLSSNDDELSPLGRSLLLAGRARRESEGARERVLRRVVGAAAAAAATTALTSAPATRTAAGAAKAAGFAITKTKLVLVAAALVASTATVAAVVHEKRARTTVTDVAPPAPAPAPAAPKRAEAPAELPAPPPLVRADELPPASAHVAPAKGDRPHRPRPPAAPVTEQGEGASDVAAPAAPEPSTASPLLAEAEQLERARAALGHGDARASMRILEDARTRFGVAGRLAEERDALEARAVFASGDRERAAALAAAFLDRYPKSPLRASIEPLATAKSSSGSKIE